jgi:hypothetical protein
MLALAPRTSKGNLANEVNMNQDAVLKNKKEKAQCALCTVGTCAKGIPPVWCENLYTGVSPVTSIAEIRIRGPLSF